MGVKQMFSQLQNQAILAEVKGKEFYKNNKDFQAAVLFARDNYNSVLLRECFVGGRNDAFWSEQGFAS